MKSLLSLVLLITISQNTYGHSASNASYQFGQVLVSINTGNYNRVQEDVKLLGELVNQVCLDLKIKDTVHIDFIHQYGCLACPSRYMFSKTEPFRYYVQYFGGDSLRLRKARHSDSLKVSSIESTIRIFGSHVDLRKGLEEIALFLYHQNKLDSSDFSDMFSGHEVYKSVFSNHNGRFYDLKENKKVLVTINKILSNKHWLFYPDTAVSFAYYFQDSLYYIVTKKDSSLIDTFKNVYCLDEASGNMSPLYLFVFSTPFHFRVIKFIDDYPFDKTSLRIHNRISKQICGLYESDIGLNGNWYIKWLYDDAYLFDHSFLFLGSDGPFVQYDVRKKEIILIQKR